MRRPCFNTVIAVSDRDRQYFAEQYGLTNVAVIPTGVDLDTMQFRPPPEPEAAGAPATVVFTGSMDWRANIDAMEFFLEEIWPLIAAARPESRMVVAGRNPPEALKARARQAGVAWSFTGFVDDIRPYVHDAQVYVIPLRVGGGTRIKVYEAMALGCPVVSTAIGVEGLPLDPDRHYLLAGTPRAFADAVLRLLADPALRARLAAQARAYVEAHFAAPQVARAFEAICARALLTPC